MDKKKRKLGFYLAVIIIAVVPLLFLFIFVKLDHPDIRVDSLLPIYGEKKPIEVAESRNGKIKIDTIYHTIPRFQLVNQLGDTITNKNLSGYVTIVDFFYTSCPSICIDMTKNLHAIQERFSEKDKDKVRILSISVDPGVDNPQKLLEYAYENDVNSKMWNLLTGDKVSIYDLARKGFMVTATEGDGGENDFIHSEKLMIIDREKRIRGYYDGTSAQSTDALINDVQKLLAGYIREYGS
ncbi:MAG: SCO family protein [Chitinophagales bacterium]|nr:SCO family protein [Chitinophagales bacterium]